MNELKAAQLHAANLLAEIIDETSPDDESLTAPNDVLRVVDAIADYCALRTYHAFQKRIVDLIKKQ